MKPNTKFGDHFPMKRSSFKDGGAVHGAPIGGTPAPGQSTRKRPKVGDKNPNYKPGKKRPATPRPSAPAPKKSTKPDYPHRDWRGVDGVVDDAGG